MEVSRIAKKNFTFKDKAGGDKNDKGLLVGVDECVFIQVGDCWINFYKVKQVDKLIRKLEKYRDMMVEEEENN